MPKRYNERTRKFIDDNGNAHTVCLYTTRTRYYVTEHAYCSAKDVEGKYKWINRPWQRFDYESAMQEMIKKLPKEWRENATRCLIDDEYDKVCQECDAFLSAFQTNYDKLSDKTKEMLAEHTPTIETMEQAKTVAAMVGCMSLLGM